MRTTRGFIRELADEAERLTNVALVVGFEQHAEFVFYEPEGDERLLTELNQLIRQGGEPVGFVGFLLGDGEGRVYTRAVAEHGNESWVHSYLTRLMDRSRELLRDPGIQAGLPPRPDLN